MTKPKVQIMIIDALFEETNGIEPEMNILKVVLTGKVAKIFYKEQARGLKTTFNTIMNCLDRIGFVYLNKYYCQIRKELGKHDWMSIVDSDCNYIVYCDYDRKNKISTMYIELKGWY